MQAVIGFDTSCYTTSVALVSLAGEVLISARKLLPVQLGEKGLRQSEGVFSHVRQIAPLVAECFQAFPDVKIKAVGISARPRDNSDSYMPVFTVGDAHGRTLASALGVPAFSFSHQRGHIRAAQYGSGLKSERFLALHLSGGTTETVLCAGEELTLLGGALDVTAGQLIDRTGVAMGLPFPAGPALEQLALKGRRQALLPVAMADGGLNCHLSGAEAQVMRWLSAGKPAEDISAEVFDLIARTISRMIAAAAKKTGAQEALVAGGVASSELFRQMLLERVKKSAPVQLYFGLPEYSGDNAAGAALLAVSALLRKEK